MLVVSALSQSRVVVLYLLLTELGASSLHRRGPREDATHIVDAILDAARDTFTMAATCVQRVNNVGDFDCGHASRPQQYYSTRLEAKMKNSRERRKSRKDLGEERARGCSNQEGTALLTVTAMHVLAVDART